MYKTFCIAALLGAVAIAKKDRKKKDKTARFVNWASKQNKHYKSVGEYNMRLYFFEENSDLVDELNERFNDRGVTFADNQFSDMSKDEQIAATGISSKPQGRSLHAESQVPRVGADEGRTLQADTPIDWFASGKMGPVKNQGGCGSCWAFAGTSTLEAMIAIRDDTTPIRLSEQQGVDCDPISGGCNGGWMDWYWEYVKNAGALQYDGYPTDYNAVDQKCQNASGEGPREYPTSYGEYNPSSYSLNTVLNKLSEGPIAVAVDADNCWMYYSGGLITRDMGCREGLNHAVVLGKYTPAEGGSTTSEEICELMCIAPTGRGKRKACNNPDYPVAQRNRRNRIRSCCAEEETCRTEETTTGGTPAFWTIQNSWGTGWGEGGFMRIEADDGVGTSGINRYMQYVSV